MELKQKQAENLYLALVVLSVFALVFTALTVFNQFIQT